MPLVIHFLSHIRFLDTLTIGKLFWNADESSDSNTKYASSTSLQATIRPVVGHAEMLFQVNSVVVDGITYTQDRLLSLECVMTTLAYHVSVQFSLLMEHQSLFAADWLIKCIRGISIHTYSVSLLHIITSGSQISLIHFHCVYTDVHLNTVTCALCLSIALVVVSSFDHYFHYLVLWAVDDLRRKCNAVTFVALKTELQQWKS